MVRLNVVFNLESVAELEELTNALKGVSELQAKLRLREEIKDLAAQRDNYREDVNELRAERNHLMNMVQNEKNSVLAYLLDKEGVAALKKILEDRKKDRPRLEVAKEADEPNSLRSFNTEAEQVIEEVTENEYNPEATEEAP